VSLERLGPVKETIWKRLIMREGHGKERSSMTDDRMKETIGILLEDI